MSELHKLPDGWEWKTIEELCEILDRLRKPISQKDRISGEYPYYGATGIVDYINNYIFDERLLLIGEDGAKWGANENTAFIAEGKYWVNNHAHIMRPNKDLVIDSLLIYYLNTTDLMEYITGATVKKLNQEKLKSINIPLPPLEEQKRIVTKLDNLFAKIDKAIALHQKNIDEADIFMASVLNDVFVELEEKYEIKTVYDLCTKITDGTHSTPKYIDSGVPFLSVKNISQGVISFDDTKFISMDEHNLLSKRCNVEIDDILYTKVGTTGIAKVVDTDVEFSIFVSIALLKPKKDLINSMYFQYILNSPNCYEQSQSRTRGVANRNLVLNDIKQIFFPLPPLKTQQKVVSYLDEISQKMEKIKQIQKEKMQSLKELKASILDKAFKGEL
ncbi:restriction endonuclease subunit S [Aliarcobacter skirrowii]|uniref:restriction endonuclease subunit S n=1 Tax=Aliarcobacter skirrowii TaxID=28200 RepID=UPI0029B3BF16|nr:restriction endonuclease subunit S [Aliarcobacter skirrowii]MDX4038380.1 restriction endonuclease subunit S [Aliarcobacter skirrowii]